MRLARQGERKVLTAGVDTAEMVDYGRTVDTCKANTATHQQPIAPSRTSRRSKGTSTHSPPRANIVINLIRCSNGCLNPLNNGIGSTKIMKSVRTLQTAKMTIDVLIGKQCRLTVGSHCAFVGTHWMRAPRPWMEP